MELHSVIGLSLSISATFPLLMLADKTEMSGLFSDSLLPIMIIGVTGLLNFCKNQKVVKTIFFSLR